jgi:hypothetical protein
MIEMLNLTMKDVGERRTQTNEWCQKRGGLYAVLAVIVTITERSICSARSYCDNNDNNGEVYM